MFQPNGFGRPKGPRRPGMPPAYGNPDAPRPRRPHGTAPQPAKPYISPILSAAPPSAYRRPRGQANRTGSLLGTLMGTAAVSGKAVTIDSEIEQQRQAIRRQQEQLQAQRMQQMQAVVMQEVGVPYQAVTCPSCGAVVNGNFCEFCGTALS